jgi:hypothetical protein
MMYYVPYLILKYGITLCLYPTFHIFSTFFFSSSAVPLGWHPCHGRPGLSRLLPGHGSLRLSHYEVMAMGLAGRGDGKLT